MTDQTSTSPDSTLSPQSPNPSAAPADSATCMEAAATSASSSLASLTEASPAATVPTATSSAAESHVPSPAASALNYAAPAQSDLRLHLRRVNLYRNLLQWAFPGYVLAWVVMGYALSMGRDHDPGQEHLANILFVSSFGVQATSILVLPTLTILLALTMKNWPDAILGGLGGLIPFGNLILAVRQTRRAERYLQARGYWRLGYDQPEKGTPS